MRDFSSLRTTWQQRESTCVVEVRETEQMFAFVWASCCKIKRRVRRLTPKPTVSLRLHCKRLPKEFVTLPRSKGNWSKPQSMGFWDGGAWPMGGHLAQGDAKSIRFHLSESSERWVCGVSITNSEQASRWDTHLNFHRAVLLLCLARIEHQIIIFFGRGNSREPLLGLAGGFIASGYGWWH